MSDNNSVAYQATMDQSRLLGNNFRTARKNKRLLAVALVTAAVVDNYQLEPLIEDSRKAMGYAKLDKPEQRQAKVFFSDLRTIVGAWSELETETQQAFLGGNLVFSTLAKAIADARKAADAAEADADADAETASEPEADAEGKTFTPTCQAETIIGVAALIEQGALTDAEIEAVAVLIEAVDAYRAKVAEQVRKAA